MEDLGDEAFTIEEHFSHCAEIVRQALICYADATLEPVLADDVEARGWGTEHACRNLEMLAAWADDPVRVHLEI
jgi:hypothetical protein